MGDESDALDGMMWKLVPDWVESVKDGGASFSTEGNGCMSSGFGASSAGGGVKVCCKGDAVYDWNCEPRANGGNEVRDCTGGERYGDTGICQVMVSILSWMIYNV